MYELLCHLYGISGASLHLPKKHFHPNADPGCHWPVVCNNISKLISRQTLRTLDTAFLQAGGHFKKAKFFDNVIGSWYPADTGTITTYDVHTDRSAHITLGVFQRLIEDEWHDLDQRTSATVSTRESSYDDAHGSKDVLNWASTGERVTNWTNYSFPINSTWSSTC